MARLFIASCMLVVLCLVTAQDNEDLKVLISQVYAEAGENTTIKNPPSAEQGDDLDLASSATGNGTSGDDTDSCKCVPYYLCKMNQTVSVNRTTCANYFDVCCASDDIVELKP